MCLKAEQPYRTNPKFLTQIQYCEENGIPFAVIIGEDEIARNVVKIRNVVTKEEVLSYHMHCLFRL
jgi:histidyl-tRNA synthetase